MAGIVLTNGSINKTVGTDHQAEKLLQQGWTIVSGSATEGSEAYLTNSPAFKDCGEAVLPKFRGEGFEGEAKTKLDYAIKQAEIALSPDDFRTLMETFDALREKTAGTSYLNLSFNDILIVGELPAEADVKTETIYLLTETDDTFAPGTYVWDGDEFIAYVAGTTNVHIDEGATALLALIDNADIDAVTASENTATPVKNAMIALAQAAIDNADYAVTIATGATYTPGTGDGAFVGKFTVTNIANPLDTATDATNRTITVVFTQA